MFACKYFLVAALCTSVYARPGNTSKEVKDDDEEHKHKTTGSAKHSGHWDHVDQSKWPGICQTGKLQSPIDVDPDKVVKHEDFQDSAVRAHEIVGMYPRMFVSNNGHSVTFHLDKNVQLRGGPFNKGKFMVQQLHFHWGSKNGKGSEHTVQGNHFSMEMHMVAYDTSEFSSIDHALGQKGGVSVLATLFHVGGSDNFGMMPLVDAIQRVRTADASQKINVHDFDLHSLLPTTNKDYFVYSGSLTTPMCNEHVTWVLFRDHVMISDYQIQQFRKLKASDGSPLADNNRNIQETNNRVIYKSD